MRCGKRRSGCATAYYLAQRGLHVVIFRDDDIEMVLLNGRVRQSGRIKGAAAHRML